MHSLPTWVTITLALTILTLTAASTLTALYAPDPLMRAMATSVLALVIRWRPWGDPPASP